jgi:hypothetical protein
MCVIAALAALIPGAAFAAGREFHVSNGGDLLYILSTQMSPYSMLTIYLDDDIDAIASATISAVGLVTIDGKGHTIDGGGVTNTALRFSNNGLPTVLSHNEITLRNLTVKNLNSDIRYGGGAIAMRSGKLTVENCAFIGNSWTSTANNAARGGGAIGMENAAGIIEITNSTFFGNETLVNNVAGIVGSGGAIYTAGGGSITNATIVGNKSANSNVGATNSGGGIYKLSGGSGVLTVSNCIVYGNTSETAGGMPVTDDVYDANTITPLIADGDYNLFGAAVNTGGAAFVPAANTMDGTVGSWSFLDTAPGDNGGSTLTIALLDGSNDAVDKIPGGAPDNDQRGYGRVGLADIGAYEFGAVDPTPQQQPPSAPPASSGGTSGCDAGTVGVWALAGLVLLALRKIRP